MTAHISRTARLILRRHRETDPLAWWWAAAEAAIEAGPGFLASLPGRTGDSIRLAARRLEAGRGTS